MWVPGVGTVGLALVVRGQLEPEAEHNRTRQRRRLRKLRHPIDYDQYTVRINTWRRNELLVASVDHHASCEGVAEIQVIWCDRDNEPPPEVLDHPSGKVAVERHELNTLNERFRVLREPPTHGILSIDDDVLRPCAALDAGFFRWTDHPNRIVGYDARLHVVAGQQDQAVSEEASHCYKPSPSDETGRWRYGYKSDTLRHNTYSMTLTRFCFVHRDYLDWYTLDLPRTIYDRVSCLFNCEDVAFSFFVSAHTGGRVPLLADFWAVQALVKLYSPHAISSQWDHMNVRDACTNDFASALGLKNRAKLLVPMFMFPASGNTSVSFGVGGERPTLRGGDNTSEFGFGAEPDPNPFEIREGFARRRKKMVHHMAQRWQGASQQNITHHIWRMIASVRATVQAKGLIEKTDEWQARWGPIINQTAKRRRISDEEETRSRHLSSKRFEH